MKRIVISLLIIAMTLGMMPAVESKAEGEQDGNVPTDVNWTFNKTLDTELNAISAFEYDNNENTPDTATYKGIGISVANGGKFSPRQDGDTQVNAKTVFTVPVSANPYGATITIDLTGNATGVDMSCNGTDKIYPAAKPIVIPLEAVTTDTSCSITINDNTYLSSMVLAYTAAPTAPGTDEPQTFPGTVGEVTAKDKDYTFESAAELKDEAGNSAEAASKLESNKGSFKDVKVDASNGKFAVDSDQSRVQINANTMVYVPVAFDSKGVSLKITGKTGQGVNASITVDDKAYQTNGKISIEGEESSFPKYVKVTFTEQVYVTSIAIDYVSDSGYEPPVISATDKVWDFTAVDAANYTFEGKKGSYDEIQIDALSGKFAPKSGNTQVNNGTVLYIPVAADIKGATIKVQGQFGASDAANKLIWDGVEIQVESETVISSMPEAGTTKYIPLEIQTANSFYLTSITVDYVSDNVVEKKLVTVGPNGTYKTISNALAKEDSSLKNPLILMIEPGDYKEKITVTKPGVVFQNADQSLTNPVVIHEAYYSSNKYDSEGHYAPENDYDKGTSACGTVIVEAAATGFTAYGITFQNDYNTENNKQPGQQTPAVALHTKADKVNLVNCKIIGRQDTLFVEGPGRRVNVENSYIEGTVDFIFGDADAYFKNCKLHMAYFAGKDNGYYTAPNTKENYTGLVFDGCTLTADEQYSAEGSDVSLGRAWQTEMKTDTTINDNGEERITNTYPNERRPGYENLASQATFINCIMTDKIRDGRWSLWKRKNVDGDSVSVTFESAVKFSEYDSKNEAGELLKPSNYEVELGHMYSSESQDPQAPTAAQKLEQLRAAMRLGTTDASLWDTTFEYTADPSIVPDPTPEGTTPGGAQGGDKIEIKDTKPLAADTGDSTNVMFYVILSAAAFAVITFTIRRKNHLSK